MNEVFELKGTIEHIHTKDITIKNGPRAGSTAKIFYATIDGTPVNVGFNNKYEEGEVVTLNIEHMYGEYKQSKKPATAVFSKPTMTNGAAGRAAPATKEEFPIDKTGRAMSIVRQNSMGHAVQIVDNWCAAEDMFPATLEDYVEMVLGVAYTVTDFSTGHRELKMAAEMREGTDE